MVTLRGGLGNQLFQLAFQLSAHQNKEVFLDAYSGYSPISPQIDLIRFDLPKRVTIVRDPRLQNKILKSLNARLLRIGLFVSKKKFCYPILRISEFICSVYFSIALRSRIIVRSSVGNGYDNRIVKMQQDNQLNIGFFQSYKWLLNPTVTDELKSLKLSTTSAELLAFIELAKKVEPLIVHVRLGDYLADPARGIPDVNYYENGINEIVSRKKPKEIWIFSDDKELAREHLQLEYENLRWISKVNNSDVETFELMRYGSEYVIGNSTFSWWAATLSHSLNPEVIAPTPWFFASPIPQDLIWQNWKTYSAWTP